MSEIQDTFTRWLKTWLAIPLLALNGWVLLQVFQYFEPLLTIFVLAAVFAFILNYPVQFLQQRVTGRGYAVFIVLLLASLGLGALGITLIPVLLAQVNEIVTLLPDWINSTRQNLQALQGWATSHRLPVNVSHLLETLPDRFLGDLQEFSEETLTLTIDLLDGLSALLLTLVLTFYFLLDGKRVWDSLFHRLPLSNRVYLRRSLQADFHRYFIGQVTLGTVTGVCLSGTFFLLGIPYSLLLGLLVGVMTLIPFGDTLSFIVISSLVATQDLTLGIKTLVVSAIVDQVIDQAIAPRILGGFTGLKPIWVLISLLFGTKVAGLPGLLTAVPIASFIRGLLEEAPLPAEEKAAIADNQGIPEILANGESPEPTATPAETVSAPNSSRV